MNLILEELPLATHSRLGRSEARLLVIDQQHLVTNFTKISNLEEYLESGDVVVVNNSGTLPASFQGTHIPTDEPVELRLAYSLSSDPTELSSWMALIFGKGDWKTPTEQRLVPPQLKEGDIITFDSSLRAQVVGIHSEHGINGSVLAEIKFLGNNSNIWEEVFRQGQPIQYSYLDEGLELWDQQTLFSGPPVSVEAPSATFQLTWELMFKLEAKGVEVIPITHAISISSTGNEILDQSLPFPERYWIDEYAANKINEAIRSNKRVIAFGTSVTRALENSASQNHGKIASGTQVATLRIDEQYTRKIVSGILTGMHVPDESHIELIQSFVPDYIIEQSYREALQLNYLWHEYGDVSLILTDGLSFNESCNYHLEY